MREPRNAWVSANIWHDDRFKALSMKATCLVFELSQFDGTPTLGELCEFVPDTVNSPDFIPALVELAKSAFSDYFADAHTVYVLTDGEQGEKPNE